MSDYDGILEIIRMFSFEKKRELEVYCKGLTIQAEDFVDVIFLAEMGQIGLHHSICRRDIIPKDRLITPDDAKSAIDDRNRRSRFFRKAEQLFKERRYLVGHMFYIVGVQKWHFLGW
jgi:hypothetical protein